MFFRAPLIERYALGEKQDDRKTLVNDKILVHGVGGKIIKAMTPNQQFG
jgi:phosphate starvation-inducible PhoH-like protein